MFFVFVVVFVEWVKFKLVPRAFSLAFPLPTSFPAPKQRKSPVANEVAVCLESGPCSSPRRFRGRSAGSFPKQRLVTEFSKTPLRSFEQFILQKNSWGKRSTEYYMWFLRKENFLFNYALLIRSHHLSLNCWIYRFVLVNFLNCASALKLQLCFNLATGQMRRTIDLSLFYLHSVKFLRKLCIHSCTST